MIAVKRICDLCKKDSPSISKQVNRRGLSLGLFCETCSCHVAKSVEQSPRSYSDSRKSFEQIDREIMSRAADMFIKAN